MCGIAGWVNFDRDLVQEKETVVKMAAALDKRGPDAAGLYVSQHALLGHRRLIVVDPAGGAQPMTRFKGEYPCTIVYNGELYNTEELRQILAGKGYKFQSYSDTEVLLVSYLEWGVNCVDHLNGIYAFGVWDEREKSLFLARDRLGVKPLFYTALGADLIFASELKSLLAHPFVEPILEEEGLLEIFGLGPARTPGSGVFKNIAELRPGYCLLHNYRGQQLRQYWKLESKPHLQNLEETVKELRCLLIDAFERQLVSDLPVCTFLSGGLDSSAISAVAAAVFQRSGKGSLDTYSIDYVDNELYFQANDFQPDADAFWVQRMSQVINSRHHNIVIAPSQLVLALDDAVKANDLPGMADVDSSLYLFCKEIKKNATVALSGECADELFGGYPWFRRREDLNAHTFPWSKGAKERTMILAKEFRRLPLEDYIQAKYEQSLQEVPLLPGESKGERRMREIFYLNLTWFMATLLNRKDRMSMANSLEVRVPFADHRIVEYAWNIPWEMKFCDNREKGLVRRALKGILPDDVLERKKSPYPKTHHPVYLKLVQQWAREILGDPSSPILQLVDLPKVKEIVETGGAVFGKPWFGQLMTGPQLIAYLIQINIWLKEYKVIIK